MWYFWLLDQETQKYFKLYYQLGAESLADYPSKAHTGAIHTHVRPYYLHMKTSPTQLVCAAKPSARQGCIETLGDPYSKGIPLPRIPRYRAQGSNSQLTNSSHTHRDPRPTSVTQAWIASKTARTFARLCLLGQSLVN